jgi:excisionase family DNA binding protein
MNTKCRICERSAPDNATYCSDGCRIKGLALTKRIMASVDPATIEAQAKAERNKRRWTPDEDFLLEMHYGAVSTAEMQIRLYAETGIARSIYAIMSRALLAGLVAYHHQPERSLKAAAEELGISDSTVRSLVRHGQLKVHGTGRCRLLSDDEFEKLKAHVEGRCKLPPQRPPVWTFQQAMAQLGVKHRNQVNRLIERGLVDVIKEDGRVLLTQASVKRAKQSA